MVSASAEECRFVVVADSFVLQVSQFFRCFVLAVRSM